MAGHETNRVEGVNFSPIDEVLSGIEYPIEKSAFVAEYGDRELERTSAGPVAVRELFAGTGEDTFESPGDVRQSLLNFMPGDSVGRPRYSDRGGSTPDETPRTADAREQQDQSL